MKKGIVAFLLLILLGHISSVAYAKEEYNKKGFFDPPEKGDQVYKADTDSGFGWTGDQKCLLCHVDYRNGKAPYKEWDWKDKYSLNSNGKTFMDSGYQRLMVPGTSPLAQFLPEQNIPLKLKNHEEGGFKFGRGSIDKEGKYYKAQWMELEKNGNPSSWSITPGLTYKDFKLKEMWMKYNPETGTGEHWGKVEIKAEITRIVDGKSTKQEVKFDGQFMGTNSGPDGRKLKGNIWTTGLGKDSVVPDDSYYNSSNYMTKTLKTLWAEYSIEMSQPWVTNHSQLGLILTPDNQGVMKITKATWSIEYRKRWDGTGVHKNFAEDTMKCAICHSSHRAAGEKLINRKTELMLCTMCHDGTGSYYNVLGGLIAGKHDSAAGPLDKWVAQESATTTAKAYEIKKATSKHDMRYITLISSAPGGSAMWTGELRCSSCHNPHGSSNFRNLRVTPNPYNWHEYGGDNRIEVKAEISYLGGRPGTSEKINYLSGMTEFCATCHVDYQAGAGGGSDPHYGNPMYGSKTQEPEMYGMRSHAMYVDGNDNPKYQMSGNEAVEVGSIKYPLQFESKQKVPQAFGGGEKDHSASIMCLTCHFGHGTTVPDKNSEAISDNNQEWYKNGLGMTKLLRAPGRGVCVACHRESLMETP